MPGLLVAPATAVINPLRSEQEAFRFLLWVGGVAVVVVVLVVLGRAIF